MASRQTSQHSPLQQDFAQALFYPTLDEREAQQTEPPLRAAEAPALDAATLPIFRVQLVREGEQSLSKRPTIRQPPDAAHIFCDYLKNADREHFVVLLLDTKNHLIGLQTVSIGTLDQAVVHPREVFKPAILSNAASVILCHNHPSGDPEPSLEDKAITARLSNAGTILGIEVLDHLIVGEPGRFCSLKQMGAM